jgi:hypothetical protein
LKEPRSAFTGILKSVASDETTVGGDGGAGWSSGCGMGRHTMCIHLVGDIHFRLLTGAAIGDISPESSSLCECTCHVGCPMAHQSDGTGWPERCSCEGTATLLRMTGRNKGLHFSLMLRESLEKSHKKKGAREAVKARGRGLNREALGKLLDEEWTRRGLDPPIEPARGIELDRIVSPPTPIAHARSNVELGVGLAKLPFKIAAMFRNLGDTSADPVKADERSVYLIRPKSKPVEVHLDEHAHRLLTHFGDAGLLPLSFLRSGHVSLRLDSTGRIEVWTVDPDDSEKSPAQRIGVISREDSDLYHQPVAAAERVSQLAVCRAVRTTDPDGRFRLHLQAEQKRQR